MITSDEVEALASVLDSDFANWRGSLTVVERCDLAHYQGWGYFHINRALRGVDDPKLTPIILHQVGLAVANIDAAIAKASLARDVSVFRGVIDGPATLGMAIADATPGTTFRQTAYLSTSIDPRAALTKAGKTPTSLVMKIEVPAGQPAAWMGQIGKKSYRGEFELLLPRQLPIRTLDLAECGNLPMLHVEVIVDE